MEKTLRDEIAMNMPVELIPVMNDSNAIKIISEKFGLPWDDHDLIVQMEFSLKYQAIIRYTYADCMMEARKKVIRKKHFTRW